MPFFPRNYLAQQRVNSSLLANRNPILSLLMKITQTLSALLAIFIATICSAAEPTVTLRSFGETKDGEKVTLYTLTNKNGLKAEIADYGGTVTRLITPDRNGNFGDIALGFDNISDYETKSPYFGCLIGRYGNRIAGGKFTLDGKSYSLATNNEPAGIPCNLHGGNVGFDKKMWKASPAIKKGQAALKLVLTSPDGDEGFPGELKVTVWYVLTNDDELKIQYKATTDKATPVNLTNHLYFNLKGEGIGDINGHVLTFHASKYTPVDAGLIPTGELAPVAGTPFDFTKPRAIGERNNADHEQIKFGGGYDHNWVLDKTYGEMGLAAEVYEPVSGRVMEVWTEEPGLQFYGGNFLEVDGVERIGKSGVAYKHRTGFCLETQHYPDSPNQDSFPSTILRPGETYATTTIYRFKSR